MPTRALLFIPAARVHRFWVDDSARAAQRCPCQWCCRFTSWLFSDYLVWSSVQMILCNIPTFDLPRKASDTDLWRRGPLSHKRELYLININFLIVQVYPGNKITWVNRSYHVPVNWYMRSASKLSVCTTLLLNKIGRQLYAVTDKGWIEYPSSSSKRYVCGNFQLAYNLC